MRCAGESLTEGLGKDAPPIGLIHTAWGGSMIEEWVTDDVAAECTLADHAEHNELLWDTNVKPYLDMTVKGWVWYQVWSALYPNPHFSSSLPLVPIDAFVL
jgi:hypothetical protein